MIALGGRAVSASIGNPAPFYGQGRASSGTAKDEFLIDPPFKSFSPESRISPKPARGLHHRQAA